MLVDLLPWSLVTEKHDMLPKLGSHASNLLQTDTGGDDLTATEDGDKDTCNVGTGLGVSMIFTNTAFYLHYRVWISMAPLFGQMEEGDTPYAMFKSPLFGLTFPDSLG